MNRFVGGMMTDVFTGIRASCERVAGSARHVSIKKERIEEYASALSDSSGTASTLDPSCHYLGHGEDTVLFILALDAINFGSGYFPHLRKIPGLSGYFTVATHLSRRFDDVGPLTAVEMLQMSPEKCSIMFDQSGADDVAMELMALFSRAWRDLGMLLLARYDGKATRLVAACHNRAENLVELLARMPFFHDVQAYRRMEVPFYKRAQLTAADLSLAFSGVRWGYFEDLDQLTIFADNLVPHVLRVDGILEYDEDLVTAIEAGELIPGGSEAEVELRACALWAVELIVRAIRRGGSQVTAMDVDYALWNRGQQPHYKSRPRHRTRTVSY